MATGPRDRAFRRLVGLPAASRHKLGVEPGDELEAELAGGTVVLRPAQGQGAASRRVAVAAARGVPRFRTLDRGCRRVGRSRPARGCGGAARAGATLPARRGRAEDSTVL